MDHQLFPESDVSRIGMIEQFIVTYTGICPPPTIALEWAESLEKVAAKIRVNVKAQTPES
jgi:hypothetical protein